MPQNRTNKVQKTGQINYLVFKIGQIKSKTGQIKSKTGQIKSKVGQIKSKTGQINYLVPQNRTNKLFSVQKVRFLEPLIQWFALFLQPCALVPLKSPYAPIKYYRTHALGFFNIPYRAKWSVQLRPYFVNLVAVPFGSIAPIWCSFQSPAKIRASKSKPIPARGLTKMQVTRDAPTSMALKLFLIFILSPF